MTLTQMSARTPHLQFQRLFVSAAVVWTTVAALIVYGESGEITHSLIIVLVWILGITGLWLSLDRLRRSSLALLESEERYRGQLQQSLAVEQQLRDKMDFTENLLINSTTPTFVIDANHKVLTWNRALEELTGVKAEAVVGTNQHWRAFYPSARPCLVDIVLDGRFDEYSVLYATLTRSRFIPDGLHAEGDYTFASRKCRLVFSSAPIHDRDGKIIAAIETLEDITERISLEAQLFHAQKMESLGVLAGGIAHDFNNVLTVINGYADLLKMTLPDDQESLGIAREISASVDRAADMTRSLLAFSGKHEIELHYDDLNLILAAIHKSLGRLIREDIALTINSCVERLPVFVDRVQIEQVLINLVVNARDALGADGKISLSTEQVSLDEARSEWGVVIPPGHYACVSVRDNGDGIDTATIERIFEPFFTTKDKGKGTGLGLSIVQSIVSKHNGCISVASAPGFGTEFHIYLPLYFGETPPERADIVEQQDTISGTETILVVEDDDAIMRLHREVLNRYGYSVLMAADGVEGVELFEAHRDTIALAVIDVIMPRMNGREVVERIRKQSPELPIIMTSGYTDDIIDRAVIDSLNVVFLQKPVKPLELLAVIGICLKRRGL
jgi:signal transduction histidine kinase/CheY-like chemotaxis protein